MGDASFVAADEVDSWATTEFEERLIRNQSISAMSTRITEGTPSFGGRAYLQCDPSDPLPIRGQPPLRLTTRTVTSSASGAPAICAATSCMIASAIASALPGN